MKEYTIKYMGRDMVIKGHKLDDNFVLLKLGNSHRRLYRIYHLHTDMHLSDFKDFKSAKNYWDYVSKDETFNSLNWSSSVNPLEYTNPHNSHRRLQIETFVKVHQVLKLSFK